MNSRIEAGVRNQSSEIKWGSWLLWLGRFLVSSKRLSSASQRTRQLLGAAGWFLILCILTGVLYWGLMPIQSAKLLATPFSQTSNLPLKEVPLSILTVAENVYQQTPPAEYSLQSFIRVFGQQLNAAPFVSTCLEAIIKVLPLLIFLYFWHKTSKTAINLRLRRILNGVAAASLSFLLFHFTLFYLMAIQELTISSGPLNSLGERLAQVLSPHLTWELAPLLANVPYLIAPVFIGLLLSVVLIQRSREKSNVPAFRSWATWGYWLDATTWVGLLVVVAFSILGILLILAMNEGMQRIPTVLAVILCTSILSSLIWLVLLAIYRRLMSSNQPPRGLISLSTVLILAVMFTRGLGDNASLKNWLWFGLTATMGIFLLLAFYEICRAQVILFVQADQVDLATDRRSFSGEGLLEYSRETLNTMLLKLIWPNRKWGLSLIGLSVALVIPISFLTAQRASLSDFINLALALDNLIVILWLFAVIWVLFAEGRESQEVRTLPRFLAILGASVCLFPITQQWLYIPVTFLLGWLALNLAVRSSKHWDRLKEPFLSVVDKRRDLFDRIIILNTLESGYTAMRREGIKQIASGKGNLEQYKDDLNKQLALIKESEIETKVDNKFSAKDVALAFGPFESAWKNGVHGAKWSFFLALPWIGLFLVDSFVGKIPEQGYPLYTFVISALIVVLKWTAYGFIFGYLYPYLRGANGMIKGLVLWIVSVAPFLPLMALTNISTTDWQASLFWVLQVFIQCMSLGLFAFEYPILRQDRYDWQMLFEVHGIASVGVSISSIIAAMSLAAWAVISSQSAILVTQAVKFVTGIP